MSRLGDLAKEAAGCTDCDLYRHATQTVFGNGPARSPIVLVGEQPGDVEDHKGRPFVGPAGALLSQALEAAQNERNHLDRLVPYCRKLPTKSSDSTTLRDSAPPIAEVPRTRRPPTADRNTSRSVRRREGVGGLTSTVVAWLWLGPVGCRMGA